MTNFLKNNKYKLAFILVLVVSLLTLTSCRFDANEWYVRPYTTYGNEWSILWNESGFFNALFAWPITILSYPIAFICSSIGNIFGGSFFVGILFTTLIVRTVAWPIYAKQNSTSLKMNLMQPEMQRIQSKYGQRKDPRSQQMMQQEMMKLYKKYKMNPLGCFGTMILQFPIFMAMYEVVRRVNVTTTQIVDGIDVTVYSRFALSDTKVHLFGGHFELNTSFMDAINAGQVGNAIFSAVIAIAFVGIQILSQHLSQRPAKHQKKRLTAKSAQQEQQQKQMKIMMYVMNFMFAFMALSSTSLGLYWLIGAIYQIFQSQVGRWLNERKYQKAQLSES